MDLDKSQKNCATPSNALCVTGQGTSFRSSRATNDHLKLISVFFWHNTANMNLTCTLASFVDGHLLMFTHFVKESMHLAIFLFFTLPAAKHIVSQPATFIIPRDHENRNIRNMSSTRNRHGLSDVPWFYPGYQTDGIS